MYLKIFEHFGVGSIVDGVWENNMNSPIWVLGATATKRRVDNRCYYGSDEYLFPQVSPPQYTLDYLLDNKYLAPIRSVHFGEGTQYAVNNSVNHVVKCNMTESSGYSHVLTFALTIDDAIAIKKRFDMVATHFGCEFFTRVLVGKNAAETEQICDEFKKGVIQNIVSVGMLLEGLNVPIADTIVLLRKSSSERVILQSIGRGTRVYPGKECVQVIDPYNIVSKLNLDNVECTPINMDSMTECTEVSEDFGANLSTPTDSAIDCMELSEDLGANSSTPTDSTIDCIEMSEDLGANSSTPTENCSYEVDRDFQCRDEEATSLACEERTVTCVAGAVTNHPVSYTLNPTTETWTGIKRICDSTDDRDVKRVCENLTFPRWELRRNPYKVSGANVY